MKISAPFKIVNALIFLGFGIVLMFEPERFMFAVGLIFAAPSTIYLVTTFAQSHYVCKWFSLHNYETTTYKDWLATGYNFRCVHCDCGIKISEHF